MSTKTRPTPTPGEGLRQEAREHAGHGHSAIAIENRRRRVYQLTLRRCSAKEIAERTGWPLRTVERDFAALHRDALLQVSTADLQKDATEQLQDREAAEQVAVEPASCGCYCVVDPETFTARHDQPCPPQVGEVPRRSRLRDSEDCDQVAHAKLPALWQGEDGAPESGSLRAWDILSSPGRGVGFASLSARRTGPMPRERGASQESAR